MGCGLRASHTRTSSAERGRPRVSSRRRRGNVERHQREVFSGPGRVPAELRASIRTGWLDLYGTLPSCSPYK